MIGGPSVTFNPYPYAQNNPVNMVDPNGEFALPVAIALLASTWAWNREVTANRAEGLTGWDAFSIDNVNIRPIIEPWAMLGAGYVGGAAIGALGFTGRTALAASAVTDIGASYLWNTQVNGSYSTTDLLFDAVFFGMGEYIGYRGVRNGRNSTAQSPSATSSANIIRTERPRGVDPGRSLRMRRAWYADEDPTQMDFSDIHSPNVFPPRPIPPEPQNDPSEMFIVESYTRWKSYRSNHDEYQGWAGHHGINKEWYQQRTDLYPNYSANDAPVIAMPADPYHYNTFGVFNTWRAEMRRFHKFGRNQFDWSMITEAQILDIAKRMANSAAIPDNTWREFMIVHNAYLDRISRR